jgi:hypothetical protein
MASVSPNNATRLKNHGGERASKRWDRKRREGRGETERQTERQRNEKLST